MDHVLLRYHEVGLKGKNQPFFVQRLVSNLRQALEGLPGVSIWRGQGQLGLTLLPGTPREEVVSAVSRVFGIAKFAFADRVERSLEGIQEGVRVAVERERPSFASFRISTTRTDKGYPLTSPEINRALGSYVQALTGKRVDLEQPDLTIHVGIYRDEAYLYFNAENGPGGLPVGTAGRVAVLLSGGIDSPVAAYRLMRRGCTAVYVHFHSFPLVDGSSREKARELVCRLNAYQFSSRLYLVPFAEVQRQIIAAVPPAYRVVTYRRFMVRIAEEFARREGALALVSGESVGQVASQTLENIATVDAVARMPILRPLIGMDKVEIVQQAQRIGTYAISIEPDEDCCSLFVPRHPVLHSTLEQATRAESSLDIAALVHLGVEGSELVESGVRDKVRT